VKAEFETLDDGSVKLVVIGKPDEVSKIYEFVTKQVNAFVGGLSAKKEKVE
jgi:acylphosphatase